VLLAFCTAQVVAQIPITPGGLGFVEAGLTGTLTLIGVPAGSALLATFAYRLFSYCCSSRSAWPRSAGTRGATRRRADHGASAKTVAQSFFTLIVVQPSASARSAPAV
jgi:uncharacterized membrane protein YbhN (UPF0104 family)